ncbi:hypothetical protein FA95DRAFT_186237 [Auriscalpium vulgare]|uniref:Uncharacterized protein n=1 Tax=Auriscalpium vulgare TaxID=40419 RepID=A0ACB8RLW0_9AGAM|nr:hypothetical protein FA95DRAFT_186237 [Auriscalpium vulgare]
MSVLICGYLASMLGDVGVRSELETRTLSSRYLNPPSAVLPTLPPMADQQITEIAPESNPPAQQPEASEHESPQEHPKQMFPCKQSLSYYATIDADLISICAVFLRQASLPAARRSQEAGRGRQEEIVEHEVDPETVLDVAKCCRTMEGVFVPVRYCAISPIMRMRLSICTDA